MKSFAIYFSILILPNFFLVKFWHTKSVQNWPKYKKSLPFFATKNREKKFCQLLSILLAFLVIHSPWLLFLFLSKKSLKRGRNSQKLSKKYNLASICLGTIGGETHCCTSIQPLKPLSIHVLSVLMQFELLLYIFPLFTTEFRTHFC